MIEPTVQPTQYMVTMLPECEEQSLWSLWVIWGGQPWNAPPTDRVWAVRRWPNASPSQCLSRTGKWVFEPSPSERTPTFYKRHRFTFEEAVEAAKREVPKIVVNGMRWQDVLRHIQRPDVIAAREAVKQ